MNRPDLEQIVNRLNAATPGEWNYAAGTFKHYVGIGDYGFSLQEMHPDDGHDTNAAADCQFVANAPADIRTLIDYVSALESELAEARANAFQMTRRSVLISEGHFYKCLHCGAIVRLKIDEKVPSDPEFYIEHRSNCPVPKALSYSLSMKGRR